MEQNCLNSLDDGFVECESETTFKSYSNSYDDGFVECENGTKLLKFI